MFALQSHFLKQFLLFLRWSRRKKPQNLFEFRNGLQQFLIEITVKPVIIRRGRKISNTVITVIILFGEIENIFNKVHSIGKIARIII